jgi:DNA-directed RNA polymerase subunit beta'
VVVEAGEAITNQHLSSVQRVVKEQLEAIESELKDQKQREFEYINLDVEKLRAEADLGMEDLRNQLDDQASAARDENTRLRDEILELRPLTFMGESRYRELKSRWGQVFRADMGAEAFYDILRRLDLEKLAEELWHEVRTSKSKQKRKKATKRLKVVEAFRRSGNRPEWMVLTVLPVIPPDLRPMVQLDGGRFATSLKRPIPAGDQPPTVVACLGAPMIVHNEKRMPRSRLLIDTLTRQALPCSRRGSHRAIAHEQVRSAAPPASGSTTPGAP